MAIPGLDGALQSLEDIIIAEQGGDESIIAHTRGGTVLTFREQVHHGHAAFIPCFKARRSFLSNKQRHFFLMFAGISNRPLCCSPVRACLEVRCDMHVIVATQCVRCISLPSATLLGIVIPTQSTSRHLLKPHPSADPSCSLLQRTNPAQAGQQH